MNKLTRKSISLLLSGTMVLGVIPLSFAVDISDKDELVQSTLETQTLSTEEWIYVDWLGGEFARINFDHSTGTILDVHQATGSDVIIPNSINGTPVKSIGDGAFSNFKMISLVIPDSVTSIADGAFSSCGNLSSISLPNSLLSIGNLAFANCKGLTSISIPNSVTSIGEGAFQFMTNLTDVDISDSVEEIGHNAFWGCISLSEIIIPNSISNLPSGLFSGCTSIKKVTIPASIGPIWSDTFYDCYSLTDIYFGGNEEQWGSIRHSEMDDLPQEITIHYNNENFTLTNYTPLPSATHHTSYLTQIPNMTASATLISGNLPKGLGIYPDGTIGGIPTQTGTFEFVVNTSEGEVGYSITVQGATSENVEADNDFDIIERIPTIDSNENDHIFEVSGEYSNFLHVYLDGEILIRDVDYTAEEGSTKLTVAAQTFAQLDEGSHTINATFAPTSATVNPSTGTTSSNSASSNVTVQKVAHTFDKIVPASTTIVVMPFSDVTQYDWFYSQVLFCYKNGTFSGVTETTYEPNTGMTRAMMAVVLHSLANKPYSDSAGFSDVTEGEWYANAVNWLSQKGIDDSYGTFRPTDLITREETAKMLYNFCTDQGIFLPLVTSSTASDIDSVSENVQLAVTALFQRNIFGGDEFGNFNPEKSSTRAEISTVMKNFMSVVM